MKKLFLFVFLVLMFCNTVYALPKCAGDDYKQWTNCFGSYTNDTGRKYTGEFGEIPGIRHGEGISILKGTKFEGTFKNDKAVLGKLTYPSGDSFEGTYNEKGNFEGKGKYTFKNGEYIIGIWVDHKLQGKGLITDPNGNERNVTFKDGKIIIE